MQRPSALRGRILVALPDLLAAALAGFSVGPMLLVVAGHFDVPLAIVLGLAGAAVAVALAGLPNAAPARHEIWWTLAACVLVVLWLAYNIRFSAQDVYATRDPATYTITGRWLVDHGSLQIQTHPEIFGNPKGGQIFTGSYAQVSPTVINSQGDHLLPAFLAVGGSLFGNTGLLKTNVVLAALALLVFYALARRVVGGPLGLFAMAVLAVSMPFVFVGRDTYSEPLTLLFLMGALLFAHRAWTGRAARNWALAGLSGGAATCVRVDSYGALIGLVVGAVVFVVAAAPGRQRAAGRDVAALLAGAAAPIVLGWLDLTHLSRQYFQSQHSNITHVAAALVAAAVVAPAVVLLVVRTRLRDALRSPAFARHFPRVAAAVLAVVFVVLASRPAWQTTHGVFNPDLVNMQIRWRAAVDGTRTYNEQTLHWQALYYGWVTVAVAFAGYGVLLAMLVRRRRYELGALLGMGLPMSALYLWNCEVSPDQPWAMRRYVPVIIPLFLIAAAAAVRWAWRRTQGRRWVIRPLVAAVVVYAVVFPFMVTWPMRHVREENGQLAQLNAICTAVGKDGAVVEADPATIFGYGQSVRSFCGVPAIGLPGASPRQLADVAAAVRAHGRVAYVLAQNAALAGGDPHDAFAVVHVQRWPNQIDKAPNQPDHQEYAVWLSRVDPSGRLVPLRAAIPG